MLWGEGGRESKSHREREREDGLEKAEVNRLGKEETPGSETPRDVGKPSLRESEKMRKGRSVGFRENTT